MHLPIGMSDFGKIRRSGAIYIDKTMFIHEIFQDRSEAVLILRPRRFGKSLNLSTLHSFLTDAIDHQPTASLFQELHIASTETMQQQGTFPTIFISFKDIGTIDFKSSLVNVKAIVSELYKQYSYLSTSSKLDNDDKELCSAIISRKTDIPTLTRALFTLTRLLHQHHGKTVWLLIDEYDAPLHASYQYNYYNDMVSFMRGFLSPALKDNTHLNKAVLTGILRVSKESLFSGINKLRVYSMQESQYAEHYGFTEAEVSKMLEDNKLSHTLADVSVGTMVTESVIQSSIILGQLACL